MQSPPPSSFIPHPSSFPWALVVACLLLTCTSWAETKTRLDAVIYGSMTDYQDSDLKEDSASSGVYLYLGLGAKHLIELEVDQLTVDYREGYRLHQYDATVVYSNFSIPSWKLRLGAHGITDDDNGESLAGILGCHYLGNRTWDAGVDGYLSVHEGYDPDLRVSQLSPRVGATLWQGWNRDLHAKLTGHWINVDGDSGLDEDTFLSLEEALTLHIGDWYLTISAWQGEQAFTVRSDGFVVLNAAEHYDGGFGISLARLFGLRNALEIRATRETFTHPDSSRDVHATTVSVLFRHTF